MRGCIDALIWVRVFGWMQISPCLEIPDSVMQVFLCELVDYCMDMDRLWSMGWKVPRDSGIRFQRGVEGFSLGEAR